MATEPERIPLWEVYIDDLEGDICLLAKEVVITLMQMQRDKKRLVIVAYDEQLNNVEVKNES